MATSPASGDALGPTPWARRGANHSAFVLVFFVLALLMSRTLSAAETARSTPSVESAVKADNYDVLRERVRTASLLELTNPLFPDVLISGSRYRDHLYISTIVPDPLNPDTLEQNFDIWNLSARASLLLQYARFVTAAGAPRSYVGLSDDERLSVQAHDADERARIAQVVRAGRYATAWRPFVAIYRKFMKAAEKAIPPGDTPDQGTLDAWRATGRVARDQGLYHLVRELRVDPADVTNEMLRSVDTMRARMGSPGGVSEHGASLLYTCESGERKATVNVHVHTWHSLAPAFFRAWEAADKKLYDPQASLIVTLFQGLSDDVNSWIVTHPDADQVARDHESNQMASNRGLISLLEHYGAPGEPNQNASPENSSPVPKPKSQEEQLP